MKFVLVGVVVTFLHVVQYASASMLAQSNSSSEHNQIEYPDIIIESISHHLGTKELQPVNLTQITTTLGYSQYALKTASEILKGQHVYFVIENVLAFRSTIDVTFDAVSRIITSLESSLHSNMCLADFGLFNVQIALQVVMDVCISTDWREGVAPINDIQTFSNEAVASSVYGLSTATKTFIISASNFVQEASKSSEIVDKNVITAVQAIVETVLNLIEIVLNGLQEMRNQENVFIHPSLIKFQFTLRKLTSHKFNLIDGITDKVTSSFTMIVNETQSSMDNLPLITNKNVALLLKFVEDHEQEIPAFMGTVEPIKSLESGLKYLSHLVHSTYKNSNFATYTWDTSSQNLIATISYLSFGVAILPSNLLIIREFHDMYEPEFQANLLYINSIIRTLNDEITLIIQRRLIDLICSSSPMDKHILKARLIELELTIKPIFLTFENVVKATIRTVRYHMACIMEFDDPYNILMSDIDAQVLFRDSKLLVSDLDRILSNDTSTKSTMDNAFTICKDAFAETVQNLMNLRAFLNKSIEQINRYLL